MQGKVEEARNNYEKAIELKEDYGDAYLNLAIVIMDQEREIVDEMNKTYLILISTTNYY